MKAGIQLSKNNEVLNKLFGLMSEHNPQIHKHTLQRIIEFEPVPSSSRLAQAEQ